LTKELKKKLEQTLPIWKIEKLKIKKYIKFWNKIFINTLFI
jgi:hypothetical protein